MARQLVTHALAVWGLESLGDDAALVVSELVANAAHHGRGDAIRVVITRLGEHRVDVGVVDTSHVEPALREAGLDEEAGRGLAIVDALSERWGWDPTPRGKRVWAELSASDEPPDG
ncbi:ATP-binding protein [Streptomyces niveus]|uniref:ATP-binding protein n=1 Tax=Streptomyces niveus TaxID=193462 RepID=UPI0036B4F5C6